MKLACWSAESRWGIERRCAANWVVTNHPTVGKGEAGSVGNHNSLESSRVAAGVYKKTFGTNIFVSAANFCPLINKSEFDKFNINFGNLCKLRLMMLFYLSSLWIMIWWCVAPQVMWLTLLQRRKSLMWEIHLLLLPINVQQKSRFLKKIHFFISFVCFSLIFYSSVCSFVRHWKRCLRFF